MMNLFKTLNESLTTTAAALVTALVTVLSAAHAQAQTGIQLDYPAYGGNGCPNNSASVTLSPDQSQLSILFDQYIVEAGATTGKRIDRKSCNVRIPVKIPQGYSISVFQVDYRGFNAIPSGGRSTFNVEYFFAGSRGPRQTKTFRGPMNEEYLISDRLGVEALVWSPCGASTILSANTSMMVQSNSRFDQVLSTVDSADISAGIVYHIQWRRCH
ncbi:MAG: DUF4360 domain-containing protein [Bdellovibrionaceae bacterium]|nr:DUF4360 domain-containing protein [Pseudobdellovibrionaceae bacterium]